MATAAVFTGALWVQHSREAWPFAARDQAAAAMDMDGTTAVSTPGSGSTQNRVPVDVTASTLQELDIRLEVVRRESLTQAVRAVATVAPDETRISHVHARVSGWVEQLDVNTTGEIVRAGQPLARIFSQELLSSQTEYLAARKTTSASGISSVVVASGRTRLTVLGMTPADIDAIEQTGEPKRLVTVVAPRNGVVVNRGVTVGTSVDPSTTLLTIADLSRVWVLAEVPEAGIPAVRVGTRAQLDFPASGRAPFPARIDFVYPTLSERTRTLRVRLSAANPDGGLRPGLYGTVAFELAGQAVITVPRDAVVDTGVQQHVFVATGDRFEPRTVTLGVQLADRVEVRAGLKEGERIVAAGVFLLDSESRLRATGGAGGHSSHGAAAPPPAKPPGPVKDPPAGHKK
ncbi:MAG TPA: efflux RND transporter periplasmic adaptor subunit [Vicinamibacterales bacterium]|nr:efflux RND transporter periplasmic adaptor subunit [Vicinamibacterales bacterium]